MSWILINCRVSLITGIGIILLEILVFKTQCLKLIFRTSLKSSFCKYYYHADKAYKVHPLFDHFNNAFMDAFSDDVGKSTDEHMTKFNPMKPGLF